MILIWCLCVCLVLAGLVFHQRIRAALEEVWLFLFGVPVRVSTRRTLSVPERPVAPPSRLGSVPPPRVVTRPGQKPASVANRAPGTDQKLSARPLPPLGEGNRRGP